MIPLLSTTLSQQKVPEGSTHLTYFDLILVFFKTTTDVSMSWDGLIPNKVQDFRKAGEAHVAEHMACGRVRLRPSKVTSGPMAQRMQAQ